MELFQRLAVLILDDVQPLLGAGRALLGLLPRLGLLAEPGRRQLERALRRDLRGSPGATRSLMQFEKLAFADAVALSRMTRYRTNSVTMRPSVMRIAL